MREKTYARHLIANARTLRRTMTPAERRLWFDGLRSIESHFRRQRPVGHYIVDFYCAAARLAIEVDGATHDDASAQAYDAARTAYLRSLGIEVMRFGNADVLHNLEGVMFAIRQTLAARQQQCAADVSPAGRGRLAGA